MARGGEGRPEGVQLEPCLHHLQGLINQTFIVNCYLLKIQRIIISSDNTQRIVEKKVFLIQSVYSTLKNGRELQGISEKCTGAFKLPRIFLKYLSIQKLPQKRSLQSIYLSNSHKKILILCINLNIC